MKSRLPLPCLVCIWVSWGMTAHGKQSKGSLPVWLLSSSPSKPSPWIPAQRGLGAVPPILWEAGGPSSWMFCFPEGKARVLGGVHYPSVAQDHSTPQLRSPPWGWLFHSLSWALGGCCPRVWPLPPLSPPSLGEARPSPAPSPSQARCWVRGGTSSPESGAGVRPAGLAPRGAADRGSGMAPRPGQLPALRAAPGSRVGPARAAPRGPHSLPARGGEAGSGREGAGREGSGIGCPFAALP